MIVCQELSKRASDECEALSDDGGSAYKGTLLLGVPFVLANKVSFDDLFCGGLPKTFRLSAAK